MALPTAVIPSTAPAVGNWLDLVKGFVKDGGVVLGLAISVIGFLFVSYAITTKFNQARQSRPAYGGKRSIALGHWADIRTPKKGATEWSEVGLLAVVGAALLAAIGFFINQAVTII